MTLIFLRIELQFCSNLGIQCYMYIRCTTVAITGVDPGFAVGGGGQTSLGIGVWTVEVHCKFLILGQKSLTLGQS